MAWWWSTVSQTHVDCRLLSKCLHALNLLKRHKLGRYNKMLGQAMDHMCSMPNKSKRPSLVDSSNGVLFEPILSLSLKSGQTLSNVGSSKQDIEYLKSCKPQNCSPLISNLGLYSGGDKYAAYEQRRNIPRRFSPAKVVQSHEIFRSRKLEHLSDFKSINDCSSFNLAQVHNRKSLYSAAV